MEKNTLTPVVQSNFISEKYRYSLLSLTLNGNILWAGSFAGIIRYDISSNSYDRYTFDSEDVGDNFVRELFIDDNQNHWCLTRAKGIIISSPEHAKKFELIGKEQFRNLPVLSLLKYDSDKILIGTQGAGLFEYSQLNNRVEKINLLHDIPMYRGIINTILKIDNNRVLTGTEMGVRFINLQSGQLKIEDKYQPLFQLRMPVKKIVEKRDNIYFATWGNGVLVLNTTSGEMTGLSLPVEDGSNKSEYVNDIHFSENKMWIGTLSGLVLKEGNTATLFNSSKYGLSHNYVFSIAEDSSKNLWIGTADGLNYFETDKNKIKVYTQENGLPSSVISSVAVDSSDNVWVSTNNGLVKYNLEEDLFISIGGKEAAGNYFNYNSFEITDSLIYFGSNTGLVRLAQTNYYSQPDEDTKISSITFTDDNLKSKRYLTFDSLSLSHTYNQVTFSIGNSNILEKNLNLVRYKLEPVQKSWQALLGASSVTFEDLSPGRYKLSVTGTNPELVGANIISAEFEIRTPFYLQWWFVSLMILIIAVSTLLIHKLILNQKLKRTLELERIKNEEAEKVRRETAADFHDELGNKLTRISLLSRTIFRKFNKKIPDAANLLQQISKNSDELYEGTKDFIWSLKTENDSLYALLLRLKDYGDEIFENTGIEFICEKHPTDFETINLDMSTRRKIAMIFKEGMTNSLKHSQSRKVKLESTVLDEHIEFVLSDDGLGFKRDRISLGDGLKNMRERANTLGAELTVDSSIDYGTTVRLRFPLNN